MTWLEPASTIVTAASLASEAASLAGRLKKQAKRIAYRIRHGKALIPIFGAGGVGKTTVSRILVSKDPVHVGGPYDESWLPEAVKLQGDIPGELLVAPGQSERVERHWPELLGYVAQGECFGLINVVSYGYHAFMVGSFGAHDIYQDGMSVTDFVHAYTAARREVELALLRRIAQGLSTLKRPLWCVTVVNKQDLWWDDRGAVKRHYTEGAYSGVLADLEASLGGRFFQHEFIPASLTIGNWQTSAGERLATTVAGYDHALHLSHLQAMLSKFAELLEQGRPR